MLRNFKNIIYDFCDSLPLVRSKTGKNGANKLDSVAKSFRLDNDNAHNAIADCGLLKKVPLQLNITYDGMIKTTIIIEQILNGAELKLKIDKQISDLQLLKSKSCTTSSTRKKISSANLSYSQIERAYLKNENIKDSL